MPDIEKIAIIGLDCADPVLLFDRWLADLPNLRRLCEKGTFGHLTSSIPPITSRRSSLRCRTTTGSR